jgi:hypothetical protein
MPKNQMKGSQYQKIDLSNVDRKKIKHNHGIDNNEKIKIYDEIKHVKRRTKVEPRFCLKLIETDKEILLVLEDDCLFLDPMKFEYEEIFTQINSIDWDLYWLGCRNRRSPTFYKNKSYKVSSVSHAQSYLIKRNMCEYIF